MLRTFKNGQTSVILRVKLLDSSSTTGAGLTGLTSASAGLIISTIADVEATATAYTQAGSTIESITTLGTYAAPTATKCRFKEVDATNHKGLYELQFADARFAVANSTGLIVSISGATNLSQCDATVQLQTNDPYLAALTAAQIATGVWQDTTAGDFTTASSIGKDLKTGAVPGAANGLFIAGTNAATTITTGLTTTFTGSLTGSVASVTAGVTLAASAVQAIWDALTSALTTVGSIGKLLVTNIDATITSRTKPADTQARVTLVDTVTAYTGNTPQTGDAYARLGAPAGASVSVDVAAVKTDTAAIKVKTDNLPAAPASTTNITAGTITTVTNLTNAPTAGDLTATMKTSVTTAATAATPTAAAVTGAVGSLAGLTASDVGAIKAKTDNLSSDPADASDIAGAFSAVNATLATIASYIDTEVAAIKAKTDNLPASPAATSDIPSANISAIKTQTDKLTFTVANQVDVNIQFVNDVEVTGDGSNGNPWNPV